jgi:hypothetical protein
MLTIQMDPAVRKILQQKFKTTRTGGKGSMRRKRKNKNSKIITSRISQEETKFLKEVSKTNQMILSLSGERLQLWKVFFEDWVLDTTMEFRKKDFNKQSRNLFINIQMEYEHFFYTNFLEEKEGIYLFSNSYKFCKKCLSENGNEYVLHFLDEVCKKIKEEAYIPKGQKEEIENVNDLLELLELPQHESPEKSALKKAYLK